MSASAIGLDSIGNILVTGYTGDSKSGYDVFLSRHNTTGSLDPVFDGGGDGIVSVDLGTYLDRSHAIALQSDGKIVVGGSLRNSATGDDFAVLRFHGLSVPTAADVTLGGRVVGPNGTGLSGVIVVLSGGMLPGPRAAQTNAFGYYNFFDVPVGHTYVVTPESTKYIFSPPNNTVNLMDEFLLANFIGS